MYQQLNPVPLVDYDSLNAIYMARNYVIASMHQLNESIKDFDKKHLCGTSEEKLALYKLRELLIETSVQIKKIHSIV